MNEIATIKNDKMSISYSPFGYFPFSGHDLTDNYNGTSFYSKAKRGHQKAWQDLQNSKLVENGAKMFDVVSFLDNRKQKIHVYCSVD